MLNSENRTCEDFGLAKPDIFTAPVNCINIGSHSQKCYEIEEKLNDDQLGVYNRVIGSISGHFADWLLQFGNGELEELPVEESLACADLAGWKT
ncbi:hypothetical protein JTE90_010004 [Oedothorax gibbosus]|uniref:Uncharacterized protein n=1 Tax=Oedothorax gibbosus TaxID=931172 RepID=A0AAV6TSY6_9ARAC|nr:hypothetical protein JTE90_010004 [Oedothorax gibbosus]